MFVKLFFFVEVFPPGILRNAHSSQLITDRPSLPQRAQAGSHARILCRCSFPRIQSTGLASLGGKEKGKDDDSLLQGRCAPIVADSVSYLCRSGARKEARPLSEVRQG